MAEITITAVGNNTFDVAVSTQTATEHQVVLPPETLSELSGGAAPEDLIKASFEYLLEREPNTAILHRFELGLIEDYFPGWKKAMRERFGVAQ